MLASLSGICSARYDLNSRGRLKRAYIIAASYRSGSTHLCTRLWETGLLGAPFEYFNYEHEMRFMHARLGASDPTDYLERLLTCRMSQNGLFGFKVHFQHFQSALRQYPAMLERLAPVDFLYIRRADKIAQAVSLAKAYQTRAWLSLGSCDRRQVPLFYDRNFIAACLKEIHEQESAWTRWFDAHWVIPRIVHYEELLSDPERVVRDLCTVLEVTLDEPSPVAVPRVTRQSDEVNSDWIKRFTASAD
jgi:LPS sulfotransferase NodH